MVRSAVWCGCVGVGGVGGEWGGGGEQIKTKGLNWREREIT